MILYFKDIPIAVMFKAFGICSDQEIMQLIGTEENIMKRVAPCLLECHNLKIFTRKKALEYMGSKLRVKR